MLERRGRFVVHNTPALHLWRLQSTLLPYISSSRTLYSCHVLDLTVSFFCFRPINFFIPTDWL